MASVAALYRNSDAHSSPKQRALTYDQMLSVVKFSGAPQSVRLGTLNALTARGRWPNEDGPASGIICVSLAGMMLGNADGGGNVVRSTARWRARRAVKLGYWRHLRDANSWSNCPECGAERTAGKCGKCPYVGRAKTPNGKANFDEFCHPAMYEIDVEAFRSAPRPRGIRDYDARTYADHKANLTNISARKRPAPTPPSSPLPPAPAAPQPAPQPARKAAEHVSTERPPGISLTSRQRKELAFRIDLYVRGRTHITEAHGGYGYDLAPGDPRYIKPLPRPMAVLAACKSMCQGDPARELFSHGCAMARALDAAREMGESPPGESP